MPPPETTITLIGRGRIGMQLACKHLKGLDLVMPGR